MESSSEQSILPGAIATLTNMAAWDDLQIFLCSLEIFTPSPPPVYIFCCSGVEKKLKEFEYSGTLYTKTNLDMYGQYNREKMESLPSQKGLSNLFHDFTQEKCDLMEWVLGDIKEKQRGVLFCDADICWLGPLPSIPNGKTLALSPHMIRKLDESEFGQFNAGFLWTNEMTMPSLWRELCKSSRFFEQAALEDLSDQTLDTELYYFPETVNYGWWRMFQSPNGLEHQQAVWSNTINGLTIMNQPVVCIHTHWNTNDKITSLFNHFILRKLEWNREISPKIYILLKNVLLKGPSYLPPLL